jgi:hypothetical protein
MGKYTKTKTTSTVEDFFNWAEISKQLTGGRDRIRKNRIPTAHMDRIEELFIYIQAWKEGKKLFTEKQLDEALSKIDLKTTLMAQMGLVDKG